MVLEQQLPWVTGLGPDLVSVTVGMNDIRDPGFTPGRFAAELGLLLDGLAVTGATVLTCTLPDIAAIMHGNWLRLLRRVWSAELPQAVTAFA